MATQPIRPALDIPEVREQLAQLVACLNRLKRPLWFFLISMPLVTLLITFAVWFSPKSPNTPNTISNIIVDSNDSNAVPRALNMTSFSGPAFTSGSDKDCVVACTDPKHWKNAYTTLTQFLTDHPNPRAWQLQTGHDRDRLRRLIAERFGSNHALARARHDFLMPTLIRAFPELLLAAQLPPSFLPGYERESSEKNQDRTPTLYIYWEN